jgi:hypothetical protein
MPNKLIPLKELFYGEALAQALVDYARLLDDPKFLEEALQNQRDSRAKDERENHQTT